MSNINKEAKQGAQENQQNDECKLCKCQIGHNGSWGKNMTMPCCNELIHESCIGTAVIRKIFPIESCPNCNTPITQEAKSQYVSAAWKSANEELTIQQGKSEKIDAARLKIHILCMAMYINLRKRGLTIKNKRKNEKNKWYL